jgi:hypothetical protein
MPATVTFCAHWTRVGPPQTQTLECDDVAVGETEDQCKARVIRRAKTRCDNGETPVSGTLIWLERNVGAVATPVASVSCGSDWEASWDEFVAACFA